MAVTTELMPTGLLPLLSRDLGVGDGQAGVLVTAYAFVVAATAVPLTAATIRWPRRRLFVTVLLGYAVSNLLMAAARSILVADAARLVGGLSHALMFSIVAAYAARLVRAVAVGRTIAVVWLGTALALLVGVPACTALGAAAGWRWPFVVLALMAVSLVVGALVLLPSVDASTSDRAPMRVVVRSPGVVLVALATGVVMLGNFMVYTYVSALLLSAGFGKTAIGPAFLLHGAAGVLGLWWSARMADRRPRLGLLIALSVLVLSLSGFGLADNAGIEIILALIGWGAAYGGLATFFNSAALRASQSADTATALVNAAFNIGIGGGAIVGAIIIGAGDPAAILGLVAAGMVSLGLILVAAGSRHAFPPGRPGLQGPRA
jgi:predicted MFS family arabinose efflux permease